MSDSRPGAPIRGTIAETLALAVDANTAEPDRPASLHPGECIGFYRIEECLGAGGMGVVYRALDTQLGRTVALKLLSPQLGDDHELLARFRGEAQIQARLTGRHIVTLHTIVQAACGLVLIMEYADGRTLARHLARHGPLAATQALRVFDHALRGLRHAHRLGVVHCDLKPGNIFLTRDGEVKLMDFGLARLMEGRRLAAPHLTFGTPRYMAPEQLSGAGADFRSDLYALGVSLYEAVTGRAPFASDDPKVLLQALAREAPPTPSTLAPGLPPALEAVIQKAMNADPARRYDSAAEMLSAVQGLRRQRVLRPVGRTVRAWVTSSPESVPPFTYARRRPGDGNSSRPALSDDSARHHALGRILVLYIAIPVAALVILYLGFNYGTVENPDIWLARLRAWIR